jgi:hypothetical protein
MPNPTYILFACYCSLYSVMYSSFELPGGINSFKKKTKEIQKPIININALSGMLFFYHKI